MPGAREDGISYGYIWAVEDMYDRARPRIWVQTHVDVAEDFPITVGLLNGWLSHYLFT